MDRSADLDDPARRRASVRGSAALAGAALAVLMHGATAHAATERVIFAFGGSGGRLDNGTVFRLAPPRTPVGRWTETLVHAFAGGDDGAGPQARLVTGRSGALYGTTAAGGARGGGTAFEVVP